MEVLSVSANISYRIEKAIAHITFDDGKANAMTVPWFEALGGALDQAEKDSASTVVFHGRSGFFSAGLDVKLLPTLSPEAKAQLSRTFAKTMLRVFSLPVPTIAQIEGHAIAGGAFLALACDARFVLEGAYRFHIAEVAIGIPLPSWMLLIATASIPAAWTVEALLHARPYAPRQALERNIVLGVASTAEELAAQVEGAVKAMEPLNRGAYAKSKQRLRAADIERVSAQLETELNW